MSDQDKPLTAKQEAAITALLASHTVVTAAKMAGVGQSTLFRWLSQDHFARAYRKARRDCFDAAIGRLQVMATEAADTLQRNLTNPDAAHAIRAAIAILQQAFRGIEALDNAERLDELEAILRRVQRGQDHPPA